jgi:hypothetical protein
MISEASREMLMIGTFYKELLEFCFPGMPYSAYFKDFLIKPINSG